MGWVIGSLRWENEFDVSAGGAPTEVTTLFAERHPKHAETISYLGGKCTRRASVVTPA